MSKAKSSTAAATAPAPPARQEARPPAAREPATSGGIRAFLESKMDQLATVAAGRLTPERVVQVASLLVYRTPRLQQCDKTSILASVMEATRLGLDLSPAMGEAYLVPRYNKNIKGLECHFQPGYKGLTVLARRSGEIADIQARLVRERDRFWYRYTPGLEFLHEPVFGPESGPMVGAYSYAKLANGEVSIEVMTSDEVEAIHRRSEGYRNAQRFDKPEEGPWVTDYGEMARKTVLRRHCKQLPRSLELGEAIEADEREYRDDDRAIVVHRRGDHPTRGAALAHRLAPTELEPPPEPAFEPGTSGRIRTEADEDAATLEAEAEFDEAGDKGEDQADWQEGRQ